MEDVRLGVRQWNRLCYSRALDMALRTQVSCALAALVVVAAACGSSSSPAPAAPRVYVGEVQGSDARVGVVATDRDARIFFCGGASSYRSMTHWIPSAPIDADGGVSQPADAAGWIVEGQVAASGASGTVMVPDGSKFSFHADPVARGTISGLYEGAGPCGKLGLIVAQGAAGQAADGQGACVPASGEADPEQVNPIRPIERATDGTIPVVVDGAGLLVHPAAAPP
jgi:hypothetical protein